MLRAGLIGFPGTGKTTLFHLLTSTRDDRSAGKATTLGVARVPDPRLDRLTAMYTPRKRVPATIEFADIAGAGTKADAKDLLDVAPYRNADALAHVVRLFRDETVPHVAGSIDAARDLRTMEDELMLADLGVVERRLERLDKDLKKTPSADLAREQEVLTICRAALEEGRPLRALSLAGDDLKRLRGFQLLSAKPLLLVANLDEADIAHAEAVLARERLTAARDAAHTWLVPVCARIELEIADLDPGDAAAFMADLGLHESGLDRVIRASYDLLGYVSFFTVGDDECRAWSIPRSTQAQEAAGEIHSDIARGFIRAEVVAYDALVARGSMAACREHGEVRLEGKEYVVQDGDVINFRFAT